MKLPRVKCPSCPKDVAVGPVAGRPSKGRLWRHDAPDERRVGGVLVSCKESLEIIDMPGPGAQLEIPGVEPEPDEPTSLF
ncbi:hypothetical protein [Streptomyces sp. NRRL S-350]|uniref:hypothetical protein n=1 Tax=Streptomyces sp. NRRL S-350 TaxID=1463902 RepID=UPI0004C23DAE|nr:hypothetical protein [Streptomyces sp. NRRL S-350]